MARYDVKWMIPAQKYIQVFWVLIYQEMFFLITHRCIRKKKIVLYCRIVYSMLLNVVKHMPFQCGIMIRSINDYHGIYGVNWHAFDDLVIFSITYFLKKFSMDDVGYLYVPKECENLNGVKCHLHVFFHGCGVGR